MCPDPEAPRRDVQIARGSGTQSGDGDESDASIARQGPRATRLWGRARQVVAGRPRSQPTPQRRSASAASFRALGLSSVSPAVTKLTTPGVRSAGAR